MKHKILWYNPQLKELAKQLRNKSTRSEIILWNYLKSKQFYGYDFHRQKPIDNYIVDFFCNELLFAIEVDGYSHQLNEVYTKDLIRDKVLRSLGITVIRFSDMEIFQDIQNVIRKIEQFKIEFEKKNGVKIDETHPYPLSRGEI